MYLPALVGYGDVVPLAVVPSILCSIQMLFGLLYVSLFIAGTVANITPNEFDTQELTLTSPTLDLTSKPWTQLSLLVKTRKRIRTWLLPCVFLVFLFQCIMLYSIDNCILQPESDPAGGTIAAYIGSFIFNVVALGLIFAVSLKFIRKPGQHQVTLLFILQAYLSVCFLFTGIYVTTMVRCSAPIV